MKLLDDIHPLLKAIHSDYEETLALMDYAHAGILSDYSKLLRLSDVCHKIEADFKQSRPFHLNVISAAARGRLKETAHSIILHDLLHHPIILSSFLEDIIGIDRETFSVSNIEYPDKDRIDLSLRTKDKFLIIENKVNSAEEQRGQLYRYCAKAEETHRKEDVIILYLNPSTYDAPSLYSRSKDGIGYDNNNGTVELKRITIKTYKHDIFAWLKNLAGDTCLFNDGEPYLKSAVLQYIDYLEEYFQIKDEFKPLHEMIEKELRVSLGLDDIQSRDSQIELLRDKKSSLERMMSEIDRLLNKLNCEKAVERLEYTAKELYNKFNGAVSFKMYNFNKPEMGFDVEHDNQTIHVTVTYTDNQYWWRVYSTHGLEDSTKNSIEEIVTPVMGTVTRGGKGAWDIYNPTSFENCLLRLSQLAESFGKARDFIIR